MTERENRPQHYIFLYSFAARYVTAAAQKAPQTSAAHSGTRPRWYSAGNVSMSMCRRIAAGRAPFFPRTTP